MELGFLLCHAKKNGEKVAISIPHITVITPIENYVRVYTDDGDFTDVTDKFDAIVNTINGRYGHEV